MAIFSKAKVKTAISTSSRQDLDQRHITTADFMQLNCAFIRHLVPKQSIDVDFNTFARLEPLPVPTFGDCTIKHHAFFVPYRVIMPGWNDFITDTPHPAAVPGSDGGLITRAACFTSKSLTKALVGTTRRAVSTSGSTYDLCVHDPIDTSHQYKYYRLTDEGRQILKILNQLGYRLDMELHETAPDIYISALPLLAFCKVYLDWYYPSAYVNDVEYRRYLALMNYDTVNPIYSQGDIDRLFDLITFVNFDADYFTSAFDNPVGPNPGLFDSSTVINDSSYTGTSAHSQVILDQGGTPLITSTSNSSGAYAARLTDYILSSLHSLTDYMKRHQLVGSRSLERYLSRFGISLNADKMNRSYMLGHYSQSVNFGAVMSNASTSDAQLGAYAGQGFTPAQQDGHFSISTDEYGIFFIMTSIVPRIGYVQGIDRHILHLSKLDFYTPEFDAMGNQAISCAELLVNQQGFNDSDYPQFSEMVNRPFGFTPRYAEYKTIQDKLTGDFNVRMSAAAGQTSEAWHMFRMFDQEQTPSDYVHNKAFVTGDRASGTSPGAQFDRIFYNTDSNADHFTLVHTFKVSSVFPGRSLFDTYDFDQHSGETLEIEAGGVKVN